MDEETKYSRKNLVGKKKWYVEEKISQKNKEEKLKNKKNKDEKESQ